MARYATHWQFGRKTYEVSLGQNHFPGRVIDDWGQNDACSASNIARQIVRKWLKSHEHLGEYNDRRVPRAAHPEGQNNYEVVFRFTNPYTAFHFKMRWG